MSDTLRTRIAAVLYRHILFRALDQCECGAAFDGFCGRSLDAYAAHVADAVIRELNLFPVDGCEPFDVLIAVRLKPPCTCGKPWDVNAHHVKEGPCYR